MKIIAPLIACVTLVTPAFAAAGSPVDTLKTQDAKIKKVLSGIEGEVPEARKKEVAGTINALFDFEELSKRSLRDHWDAVAGPKRDEFVGILTQLIKDASVEKLDIYRSEVSWDETTMKGAEADVLTNVEADDEEIEVIYKLHQVDGQWRVYDLVIDDISTVEDYRATFNKEIKERGFDSLLQKLRDKRDGKEPEKGADKKAEAPKKK